jgi:hypothetical protein
MPKNFKSIGSKKYHAGKAIALLSSNKRGGNPFTMAFIQASPRLFELLMYD